MMAFDDDDEQLVCGDCGHVGPWRTFEPSEHGEVIVGKCPACSQPYREVLTCE